MVQKYGVVQSQQRLTIPVPHQIKILGIMQTVILEIKEVERLQQT